MSKFVNNLHRENSRLRDEISKLRRSLQEINSNLGSKSPVVHKKPEKDSVLSSLNKQNMIKNFDLIQPVSSVSGKICLSLIQ